MLKNKRTLIYSLLVFIFILVAFLCTLIYNRSREIARQKEQSFTLPDFTGYLLNGAPFSKKDIPEGYSVVLTYVNPDCASCDYEAQGLRQLAVELPHTMFLVISRRPVQEIIAFAERNKINDISSVKILHDRDEQIYRLFGIKHVPSIFIYNNNHRLVKQFKGETKKEAILKFAK